MCRGVAAAATAIHFAAEALRPLLTDRASNDADVSSTPPIIPHGGFSPIRLEGWHVGQHLPAHGRLKPAPGMRRPSSSLHPPFVHLVVNAIIPHCVGPRTRLRTALEGYYSSTPGVLARVRVIVSRSVITYSTPSVPLVGTPRFHRKAAYTRCLRCAGAARRPASGSGFRCSFRILS